MSTVQFQLGGTLKFVTEPEGYALITITYDRFTITAKGQDMAYTLPNDHLVQVQVAYVDSHGRRRLPINDAAHVRNALARFNQVMFDLPNTTPSSQAFGQVSGEGQPARSIQLGLKLKF